MKNLTQLRKNPRVDKNRSDCKQPRKFDLIQVQDLSGRVGGFQIGLAISQPLPRSSVDDVIDSVVTEAHQSAPAEPSSLPLSHMEDDAVRWSRLSSWDVYNYISHMHLDHHLGLMNIMQLRERAFISQDNARDEDTMVENSAEKHQLLYPDTLQGVLTDLYLAKLFTFPMHSV